MSRASRHAKRIGIGIIGSLIALIGIVAIPYPGPGWLIVFAGLAVLATEFDWAQRLLDYGRAKYDTWVAWLKRQSLLVRAVFIILTTVIVIATLWLLNGYGILNDLLNLHYDWLRSPFLR
jgi:uncharacterized protein (TIGR02611 family)